MFVLLIIINEQTEIPVIGCCELGRLEDANEILPGLWLGSLMSAKNKYFLKSKGITHVLSVIDEETEFYPDIFKYKHIWIDDQPSVKISDNFKECHEFIGALVFFSSLR